MHVYVFSQNKIHNFYLIFKWVCDHKKKLKPLDQRRQD